MIARVIAENVETLHEMRWCALPKVQQAHIELMSLLQAVAALESRRNHEQDPAERKRMKKELDALRVKQGKAQGHRDRQQQIIEHCEEDLVLVGELERTAASGGNPSDAPTSTASEETAEAPVEASGLTQEMPSLKKIWRWAVFTAPLGQPKTNSWTSPPTRRTHRPRRQEIRQGKPPRRLTPTPCLPEARPHPPG